MADEPSRRKHKTRAKPPLSAREIRFCQHLMEHGSQYDAYIAAGLPPKDDRSQADKAASRLVRKREIREFLRHLQHVEEQAARVTVAEVVAAIRAIAFADRRKLYDAKGRIRLPHDWPDDLAAAVEQVESDELFEPVPGAKGRKRLKGHARKVKFTNRLAALSKLAEIVAAGNKAAAEGETAAAARGNTLVVVRGPVVIAPPADEPEESPG